MADRIRQWNLLYCEGAHKITEVVRFYKSLDGRGELRKFSHARPQSEMTFDESGKLTHCVYHWDDMSLAYKLYYDPKGRLRFVFILNGNKSKIVGGSKYAYDTKNRLICTQSIVHYGGFAAPPFDQFGNYCTTTYRYRGRRVKIKYANFNRIWIHRYNAYHPVLHDGNYDFKQQRAPASLLHNRMLAPFLTLNEPKRMVKSRFTGNYFYPVSFVFNEKGHWTSHLLLDHNEQPWLEFRREITYYDDFSAETF